jgi:hypothetical protein
MVTFVTAVAYNLVKGPRLPPPSTRQTDSFEIKDYEI